MAVSISDVLKTAKSLTANMRHRDTVVESNRRIARSALSRMESNLDADGGWEKMTAAKRTDAMTDPLPDLIRHCPQYRKLHEENEKLYVVVAEQQLTLEMIMEKYREKISQSSHALQSFLQAQKCLEKHDGILGSLLHEKGVALQAMEKAVWEDDDGDFTVSQHSAEISSDNATLNEVVQASLRMNGRCFLNPHSAERGNQTSPISEVAPPIDQNKIE